MSDQVSATLTRERVDLLFSETLLTLNIESFRALSALYRRRLKAAQSANAKRVWREAIDVLTAAIQGMQVECNRLQTELNGGAA